MGIFLLLAPSLFGLALTAILASLAHEWLDVWYGSAMGKLNKRAAELDAELHPIDNSPANLTPTETQPDKAR